MSSEDIPEDHCAEDQPHNRPHSYLSNILDMVAIVSHSATHEFDRFCEIMGWRHLSMLDNRQDTGSTSTSRSSSVSGDGRYRGQRDNFRHAVDAEIQTDDYLLYPPFKRARISASTQSNRSSPQRDIRRVDEGLKYARKESPGYTRIGRKRPAYDSIDTQDSGRGKEEVADETDSSKVTYSFFEKPKDVMKGSVPVKRLSRQLEKIWHPPMPFNKNRMSNSLISHSNDDRKGIFNQNENAVNHTENTANSSESTINYNENVVNDGIATFIEKVDSLIDNVDTAIKGADLLFDKDDIVTTINNTMDTNINNTMDTNINNTMDTNINNTMDININNTMDININNTMDTNINNTMDTNINNTMDTDNSNTMDTDNSNTMNTDNSNTMDTTINNTVDTEHTSNDNEDREMSYKRDLFLSISEEERVEKLERTIVDIQSQMNTIISYPPSSPSSSNESIPTVLSENNTLGKDQTDSPPTLPTELRRNRSTDQSSFYQSLQMKLSPTYHISPHRTQRLMNKPVNNKPSDQHMASMRQIVEMIPTVQLKTTDIIVGPDGITRPNPFWIEMYGSKRRTL